MDRRRFVKLGLLGAATQFVNPIWSIASAESGDPVSLQGVAEYVMGRVVPVSFGSRRVLSMTQFVASLAQPSRDSVLQNNSLLTGERFRIGESTQVILGTLNGSNRSLYQSDYIFDYDACLTFGSEDYQFLGLANMMGPLLAAVYYGISGTKVGTDFQRYLAGTGFGIMDAILPQRMVSVNAPRSMFHRTTRAEYATNYGKSRVVYQNIPSETRKFTTPEGKPAVKGKGNLQISIARPDSLNWKFGVTTTPWEISGDDARNV